MNQVDGFVLVADASVFDRALENLNVKPGTQGFLLLELTDKTEEKSHVRTERNADGTEKKLKVIDVYNYFRVTTGSKDGIYTTLFKCQFVPVRIGPDGRKQVLDIRTASISGARLIVSASEFKQTVGALSRIEHQKVQIQADFREGKCIAKTPPKGAVKLNVAIPVKDADTVKFLAETEPLKELYASAEIPVSEIERVLEYSQRCISETAGRDTAEKMGIYKTVGLSFGDRISYSVSNSYEHAMGELHGVNVRCSMDGRPEKDAEGNVIADTGKAPFIGINPAHLDMIRTVAKGCENIHVELRGDNGAFTHLCVSVPETGSDYRFPIRNYGLSKLQFDNVLKLSTVEGTELMFDRKDFLTATELIGIGTKDSHMRFNLLSETEIGIGDFMNLSVENGQVTEKIPASYNQMVIRGKVKGIELLREGDNIPTVAFCTGNLKNIVNTLKLHELTDQEGKGSGEMEKVRLRISMVRRGDRVIGSLFAMNVPEGCVLADSVYDVKGTIVQTNARSKAREQSNAGKDPGKATETGSVTGGKEKE